jgi:hypothetical protein
MAGNDASCFSSKSRVPKETAGLAADNVADVPQDDKGGGKRYEHSSQA